MLTLGVHTDKLRKRLFSFPRLSHWLYLARPSSDAASYILKSNPSLKEAAMPMGSGNTVTLSLLAYPCSASLHQLNFLIPKRGMASDWSHINAAFSASVNLEMRSFARSCEVKWGFLYGNCL